MGIVKPVYLLADSELLFWAAGTVLFLKTLLPFVSDPEPSASYIGVSNGDQPEFYDIFCAALDKIGIPEKRMIRTVFSREDQQFLKKSSIVLLAGGDPVRGWDLMKQSGLSDAVRERYAAGAVLIGVSAGAMQLGLGIMENNETGTRWIETLQIVPFVVDVRGESTQWRNLQRGVQRAGAHGSRGIGIPRGGGIAYHSNHSLEPVRRTATELRLEDGQFLSNLLLPDAASVDSFSEH